MNAVLLNNGFHVAARHVAVLLQITDDVKMWSGRKSGTRGAAECVIYLLAIF